MATQYDQINKIWSGPDKEKIYDADCSIGRLVYQCMKNYPKAICQISDVDGVTLTNSEALTAAIRIAQHLKRLGLRHDDVIGISAKNTTYVMPVIVASLLNCTPFHAVNPMLDDNTQNFMFQLTKPNVIFCDGEIYHKIQQATKELKPKIFTLTDHIEGVPSILELLEPTTTEISYRPERLVLGGGQTAAILCSSGTTGMPKAVCLSNRKIMFYSDLLNDDDVLFGFSTVDWLSGIFVLIYSCTQCCTRIITTKPYTPEFTLELVEKYKITYLFMAPYQATTFSRINNSSSTRQILSSVRLFTAGGGPIALNALQLLNSLMSNANMSIGYGFTEVGGWVTSNLSLDKGTSVGKLVPGLKARIVDDAGQPLGPNEVGELLIHDSESWTGYYGDAKQTLQMRDALGWFHSGDLGYFDEEHYLYIVDRKKEIMKYQGHHYWPGELEETIAELSDVINVCVVGIDDNNGSDAAGAVVLKTVGSLLSAQDIVDYVKRKLVVPQKQLHAGVLFVERMPQNNNGKTLRRAARDLFLKSLETVGN